ARNGGIGSVTPLPGTMERSRAPDRFKIGASTMSECQRIADLLEGTRPGELDPAVAGQVEAHLAQCPSCRSRRERDAAVAAMIRSLPGTPAPPALRRRIERDASPS